MPWDPLGAWPRERPWIWLTVAGWLVLLRGPAFLGNLRAPPPAEFLPDFFQEYASARNWREGLALYDDQRATAPRYVGVRLNERHSHVFVNAHAPAAVLLASPLARLGFDRAFLVWNLASLGALAASLWIVQRSLRIEIGAGATAPAIALVLLCFPLWEQCRLGQLTLVLLFLITAAWAAERRGRLVLAGALIGAAACVKLFPSFLFVYFALRGRWRLLLSGALTIAALTALTAAIFGFQAHRDYALNVLPAIQWFRVGWNNDLLWGFWSRLFDPAPEHVRDRSLAVPLFYSPLLANALSLISAAGLTALLAWAVRRDRTEQKRDLTFALAVAAMLLVSLICWEHYLPLMLAPLAIVWVKLPPTRGARATFLVIVAAFWLGYPVTWTDFDLNGRAATPVDSIGILSYQFYALLVFCGLVARMVVPGNPSQRALPDGTRSAYALGAIVMAALWLPVLHEIWQRYGMFYFIAGDFAIFRSTAIATSGEGTLALYNLDVVVPYAEQLRVYYGPDARGLNLGPGPYPAVYILPFLCLSRVSPSTGYAIWTAVGVALAFAVVRGMSIRNRNAGWGLVISAVLFFPLMAALILGQLTMLFFYGFYRSFRALEEGRDLSAGLWAGALYLKPQYVVWFALALVLKRRWHAIAGLALAGMAVLLSSLAIVGTDGFAAWYQVLGGMSGFRKVLPMVSPQWMINWRGLFASFLPEDISERTGQLATAAASLLTVGTLLLVWRGRWEPRTYRFATQMLATVIVMMMASYHNHIHSASLLLVPGLAVAAHDAAPLWLGRMLLAGLYVPLPLYFVTGSMMYVSWLFIGLMLATLAVLVHAEVTSRTAGVRTA
jgi:hypothetical protein